jgi:hypothetical protein
MTSTSRFRKCVSKNMKNWFGFSNVEEVSSYSSVHFLQSCIVKQYIDGGVIQGGKERDGLEIESS